MQFYFQKIYVAADLKQGTSCLVYTISIIEYNELIDYYNLNNPVCITELEYVSLSCMKTY